ncbi:MAG: hypothetical protein ASARMPREDX12_006799 [Alectoria sarmentosa]|nr:MAG: hypothetical protein ASARMPREDX12_006799 [Alectoria sarmentosa]
MDPRLNRQGRPRRLDSELALEMPVGAFMWMQQPAFVLDRPRSPIPIDREGTENIEQAIFVPEFRVTTTKSRLEPGIKKTYRLLPFRALEETCLPAAIQQRWEASVAASRSAEWRLWFEALDDTQQKAHVQSLTNSTKGTFWAGLWLEYEEWSKPRHARFIAAAARAIIILERKKLRKQMDEAQNLVAARMAQLRLKAMFFQQPYPFAASRKEELRDLPRASAKSLLASLFGPLSGPLSAPPTPSDIVSLGLRLPPCYFRLPAGAFRFATQIFSGKSYEEAVAEQKASFNSWANMAAHKNAAPNLTPKKKQPQTGKYRGNGVVYDDR